MIDFQELFGRSPNPYMVLDRQLRFVAVNEAYLRVTGRSRGELLGVHLFDAFPGDPDDPDDSNVRELRGSLESVFATGRTDTLGLIRYAIPRQGADGAIEYEERFWSATHTPLPDADGAVRHVLQHTVDVTELQRLKAELREARARQNLPVEQLEHGVFERARQVQRENESLDAQRRHLLRLFDEAPGFMAYLGGPDHVFELVNRAYVSLIGGRDVIGRAIREALPELAGQGYFELLDEAYRTGRPFVGMAAPVAIERNGASEQHYVDFVYQPVTGADGRVSGILVQGHDITVQQATQAELDRYRHHLEELVEARTRDLERSEAALAQARKLEDIGKLTGGVAHDFNNVLQIIGTNLQLLQAGGLPTQGLDHVKAARQGVERGGRLASQLLSFARRQPLRPQVLDLAAHLEGLATLLRGTVGEAIELRLEIEPGLCAVEVDPHQLDNALINLALNARDAMRGRGTLVLTARTERRETADGDGVPAGSWGLLTMVDHGCGMAPDVLAQAFDPFFTTKDVGQGTGLGLSMVYGFAKQSGGHVLIASEPGAGTEVRLWLPASDRPPDRAPAPVREEARGGSETVLLVEDDAAVRESVAALVRTLGYRVTAVEGTEQALDALEDRQRFDVLFTDLVMPGRVSGLELARRARVLQPGIAILLTSGYSSAMSQDGVERHMHLLPKPYGREELALKLREALAPPAPRAPLRVLVVDDNADTHGALTALLRLLGHQAQGTSSAADAWSALEHEPWDAVLTDLDLDGTSGADLARRIRERWPRMRVIVASGASRDELDRIEGVQAVLQKPFAPEALVDALNG